MLAFLLTTKVWSPQYSLWLVPLLALARPRWRLSIIWQFSEVAVWFMTLTLFVGQFSGKAATHGVPYGWLCSCCSIRDALLVALAALVVREIWFPEFDCRPGGRHRRSRRWRVTTAPLTRAQSSGTAAQTLEPIRRPV